MGNITQKWVSLLFPFTSDYSGKFSEFRDSFNFTKTIDEIFDLLNNSIQKQNLLILEYEELKLDPFTFLQTIASFMEIAELTKD